jgi:transcriptional regulator with XRE-family HTH domain
MKRQRIKQRIRKEQPADPDLGRSLAVLRESRGWYQSDVADASGIPPSTICQYEQGTMIPGLRNLTRVVNGMGYELSAVEETRQFLGGLRARHGIPQERDREQVPILWARLSRYSPKVQIALVREAREFQSWALVEFLCDESSRSASDEAAQAVHLAKLAVEIAEALPGSSPWLSKLRGFAAGHLANAHRVAGHPSLAESVFATSDQKWQAGRHDPTSFLEEARLLALKASLRRDQRRLPESLELLNRALAQRPTEALRVTVLINRANVMEAMGEVEDAITALQEAEPSIVESGDAKLLLCLRHNLADYLSKADRYAEAESLLPEVTKLSQEVGGEMDRIRLRWVKGRVLAGFGRLDEAVGILTLVRGEFAARDIAYDTALVSLELATLYAKQGRATEVKTLARHLVPIFQAEEVHREALAALTVFRQAAERESLTVELAQRITAFLRRAQHDPNLTFS